MRLYLSVVLAACSIALPISTAEAHKPVSPGSVRWCKRHPSCIKRVGHRFIAHVAVSMKPVLDRIASCESGGNPRAISPGGAYRGLFQFDRQTWAGAGGSGDPAAASVGEQYERAAILYQRRGSAPWPICGRT